MIKLLSSTLFISQIKVLNIKQFLFSEQVAIPTRIFFFGIPTVAIFHLRTIRELTDKLDVAEGRQSAQSTHSNSIAGEVLLQSLLAKD